MTDFGLHVFGGKVRINEFAYTVWLRMNPEESGLRGRPLYPLTGVVGSQTINPKPYSRMALNTL